MLIFAEKALGIFFSSTMMLVNYSISAVYITMKNIELKNLVVMYCHIKHPPTHVIILFYIFLFFSFYDF